MSLVLNIYDFLVQSAAKLRLTSSGFMASGSSVQARMSASTFSFSMYLFASAIIFSLSLGITMPFSKLGYISFPNRDIIFSLSPLQVTSSGGEVHLPYPEYPSSL